jgi:rhamnogalacturonyl hydrolase YesR
MERILERSDFEEINKLIQDPKTMSDIVNNKKDNLSKKLKDIGLNQESIDSIIKEILKKYAKISSKNAEERPQYTALIEAEAKDENDKKLLIEGRNQQHSEKIENQDWDDYLTKATDFMIKESTNTSTLLLLQELMIEGKIKSLFDANNDFSKDKDLAMMKDILGVGTWDISDNNLDYAIEA